VLFGWLRRRRRQKIRSRPFPSSWLAPLEALPLYERLADADQAKLRDHLKVFLAEKTFTGCGGQEITDEVRVTIGAHACLLLLHRETEYYPDLDEILVYPHAYRAKGERQQDNGVVSEGDSLRLGESWLRGPVVLAWDAVKAGFYDVRDGGNVAIHEFAHQLDQEDGRADGAPPLGERARYAPWARVLSKEFERLRSARDKGRKTLLDTYGATNPAEFFAVVSETFFERPKTLLKKHPELYAQLSAYYQQDPAET
jgi:MtfA peptidase